MILAILGLAASIVNYYGSCMINIGNISFVLKASIANRGFDPQEST